MDKCKNCKSTNIKYLFTKEGISIYCNVCKTNRTKGCMSCNSSNIIVSFDKNGTTTTCKSCGYIG